MDDRFLPQHSKIRCAEGAARSQDPYTCVTNHMGEYVGFEHRLKNKLPGCRLGSEVPTEVFETLDRDRARNVLENIAFFKQQLGRE